MKTKESTVEVDGGPVHVTEIDRNKRVWKRILIPGEEREMAAKMLRFLV